MSPETAAAVRYAQAFVTLAHRQGELEPALTDLAAIQDVVQRQPLLQQLVANPEVSVSEKQTLLTKLFERRVSPLALQLTILLLWKGRLPLLPTIVIEARRLRDEVQGIVRGVVQSVRPVPAPLVATLRERLAQRLGRRVELTTALDPTLIGGVAVRLGNQIFDGSVRQALANLKERLYALAP